MRRFKENNQEKRILITSALPYIHGMPHLGNLVGSVLPADVFHRYTKLAGYDSIYICGSDAHGTSYELEAEKRGITPEEVVEEYHEKVQEVFDRYNIDFTYYGSTHSEQNRETTYEIFGELDDGGYLIERTEELPFCRECDRFQQDRFVEGECPHCGGLARGDQCNDCGEVLDPDELLNPYCTVCDSDVELRETTHLYINLTEFQDWLEEWFEEAGSTWTPLARGTTKGFFQEGLEPRAMSRDTDWGFNVPKEGYEDKVLYVWFDAPIGYIGITRQWADKNDESWEKWWTQPDDVRYVQFMGKDNVFFHSILFPSFLHGADREWKLVDDLIASGWLLAKDVKFSKSTGTGLSAMDALDAARADVWRYVLMALYPESDDTEFTLEEFQRLVNSELSDNIGNFIHRVLTFTKKNFGEVPERGELTADDEEFLEELEELEEEFTEHLERSKLRQALKEINYYAKLGNSYLNEQEPWNLDEERAATVMALSCEAAANLSIYLHPYIPESSEKVWDWFGIEEPEWHVTPEIAGNDLGEAEPLFHKIDDEKFEEMRERFADGDGDGFSKLDLRVGEIEGVKDHPDADKLYVLQVDLGNESRQLVAGLKGHYTKEELPGRKIVVLTNLEPATIRGVESRGMLLAGEEDDTVGLLTVDAEPGTPVTAGERDPADELSLEEFKEVEIEVREDGVYSGDSKLVAGDEDVVAEKVGPGAEVL